jgi:hypothetical protein
MKSKNSIFTAVCAFLCSCVHETTTFYQDDKVKVLQKSTTHILNVHASHDEMWLEAFGKTYKDVRGLPPFYLEISGKNSILFVTGRTYDDGQATVHILNYKTHKEIHFPAYDSDIGRNIGGTPSSGGSEKIESVNGDKIEVSAQLDFDHTRSHIRYYLDLAKPEFEREEGTSTTEQGTNTWSWVYPNGKRPRE